MAANRRSPESVYDSLFDDEFDRMVHTIMEPLPDLPTPKVKEIEKVPFKLSELSAKMKDLVVEKKHTMTVEGADVEIKFIKNGAEVIKTVKRKSKPVQKTCRRADSTEAYKLKLGLPINTPLFYRYIRVPAQKKNDPLWRGIRKDACLLIYAPNRANFMFTFAIWNGIEPKGFIKDEARYLCQSRMLKSFSVAVANVDQESSHLENVKRAINNHLYALNKRAEEPVIQALRVAHPRTVKELASLIEQKFKMENI